MKKSARLRKVPYFNQVYYKQTPEGKVRKVFRSPRSKKSRIKKKYDDIEDTIFVNEAMRSHLYLEDHKNKSLRIKHRLKITPKNRKDYDRQRRLYRMKPRWRQLLWSYWEQKTR